jgi:hypothetical protein
MVEVVVGRRPGMFVRQVSMKEGRRLQRISRTAKDAVRLRRAIVVMVSAQGQSVPAITSFMQVSADMCETSSTPSKSRGLSRWTQNGAEVAPG